MQADPVRRPILRGELMPASCSPVIGCVITRFRSQASRDCETSSSRLPSGSLFDDFTSRTLAIFRQVHSAVDVRKNAVVEKSVTVRLNFGRSTTHKKNINTH